MVRDQKVLQSKSSVLHRILGTFNRIHVVDVQNRGREQQRFLNRRERNRILHAQNTVQQRHGGVFVGDSVRIPDSIDVSRIIPTNLIPCGVRDQPRKLAGNKSHRVDIRAASVRNVVHVDQKPNIRGRHSAVLGRTHTIGRQAPGTGHPSRDVQACDEEFPKVLGVVFDTNRGVRLELLHVVQKRRGRRQQIQRSQFGHIQNDRHVNGRVRHVRLAAIYFAPNRQPRAVSSIHIPHSHRASEPTEWPSRQRHAGDQGRRRNRRTRVPSEAHTLL